MSQSTLEYVLANRIQSLDTSAIRKAFELAGTLKNPINLSIGQPHFPCPPNIIEAGCKALKDGKTAYTLTGGIPELKNALVEKYKNGNGISYATPERILVTSGISSAFLLLFNSLLNEGDECLVVTPHFLMYPAYIKIYGGTMNSIHESFEPEALKKFANKKLKIIIYSSPSNPTGKILSRKQLEALAELAEKTGAYLISDEIYELFDYDKKFISVGSFYDKAITLSGFSKTYSMTGLRLSSILAPEPIIKALTTLQQYTLVCAPSVTQWMGLEALKTDMSSYIADYKEKRDFVFESLKDLYEIGKSEGAFYFFIKIKEKDDDFIVRAVKEKELILVPGYIFTESKNYIRISFASEWENLKRGISALAELA
ncbi:pyridoxal phosphate-dependent aminotransferase [Leptospira santarosai]|uniref:pyridoxal phosphate-dependent aminotransferase n=1 Tax=Leptospira santarosai TaxID=28183 RepID=UPI0024AED338|nr:aminotransferase class I/II-fold pyridoxal phosphate-dependent enzyme [Leptospira santarosai]MDI7172733.1 aminotransferase class I/II-fold pyridoxal phosphate-dependent enzyme [Leptospira santarosai]MDI7192159.1 aminotransferase class I/II-fold pyridoxal phosphate-dependent enzyme [Leptospira santarosai]MDO6396784.1 aminotransferase class I/II-fold pyridoxal phosphate-dependent enzyme [Leptospira santarosai]MDO6401999.1 aminotransferase class I/II-fold pyridoxal phosphate-dependent enzyme [L